MRWTWALLTLAGCNQVFGLQSTQPIDAGDAAFFDAPPDAPFACPPPGGAPAYSPLVHQIVQDCRSYTATEDGTLAAGLCFDDTYTLRVAQSESGGAFTLIPEVTLEAPDQPRLAPEGDEMFVVSRSSFTPSTIEAYRRNGSTWEHAYTVDPGRALTSYIYIGVPTRGPKRRMMISVYNNFNAYELAEIELDATSGRIVQSYPSTLNGGIYAPYLSPDGLRMYVSSTGQPTRYFERSSLGELWSTSHTIDSLPLLPDEFMTPDCARVYVYSQDLRSLFWVQQR